MLALGGGAGALAAALLATPAGATTYTVTNGTDSGAGSLRQAILDANAHAGLDAITFASGFGVITLSSDLPVITEGLTIAGPGSGVLDISGLGAVHAFTIDTNGTGGVVISGLSIVNSAGATTTLGDKAGGAIYAVDSPLRLQDVSLRNNAAQSTTDAFGGALAVDNATGTGNVEILDSAILDNSATTTSTNDNTAGGGAWVQADDITVRNTVVSRNTADFGGGIYLVAKERLDVTELTVTDNHAAFYAGGAAMGASQVTVADSVITGNTSDNVIGGAYVGTYNTAGTATMSITNTTISNNTADELGGMAVFSPGQIAGSTMDRITVTGNHGDRIGGLSVMGSATLSSSTIADNVGAGVNFGYDFGPVSLAPGSASLQPATPGPSPSVPVKATATNTTVSGNSREGIAVNVGLNIVGSTSLTPSTQAPYTPPPVELNLIHVLAADNGLEDVAATAFSLFSLIEKPNAGVFPGYGTQTGVDPGLQPLLKVSATVSVVPILPGSAAWDAGYPDFTPPPATDQRGLPRVVEIIDIGAYEVQELIVFPRFTG